MVMVITNASEEEEMPNTDTQHMRFSWPTHAAAEKKLQAHVLITVTTSI
jgi:hypothetical protein